MHLLCSSLTVFEVLIPRDRARGIFLQKAWIHSLAYAWQAVHLSLATSPISIQET